MGANIGKTKAPTQATTAVMSPTPPGQAVVMRGSQVGSTVAEQSLSVSSRNNQEAALDGITKRKTDSAAEEAHRQTYEV